MASAAIRPSLIQQWIFSLEWVVPPLPNRAMQLSPAWPQVSSLRLFTLERGAPTTLKGRVLYQQGILINIIKVLLRDFSDLIVV